MVSGSKLKNPSKVSGDSPLSLYYSVICSNCLGNVVMGMGKCVKMCENVQKCAGDPFSIYYSRAYVTSPTALTLHHPQFPIPPTPSPSDRLVSLVACLKQYIIIFIIFYIVMLLVGYYLVISTGFFRKNWSEKYLQFIHNEIINNQ